MKRPIHVLTVKAEDIREIAARQRERYPKITWKEATRQAWAWVRAMSGIPAWPEPDADNSVKLKRARAPRKRLKPDKSLRSNPWWKVTTRKASKATLDEFRRVLAQEKANEARDTNATDAGVGDGAPAEAVTPGDGT